MIPEAGHFPWIERRGVVRQVVEDFLQVVEEPESRRRGLLVSATERLVGDSREAVETLSVEVERRADRDAVAPTELFGAEFGPHVLPAKHRRYPPAFLKIVDEHGVTLDRHVREGRLGILHDDDGLGVGPKVLGLDGRLPGRENDLLAVYRVPGWNGMWWPFPVGCSRMSQSGFLREGRPTRPPRSSGSFGHVPPLRDRPDRKSGDRGAVRHVDRGVPSLGERLRRFARRSATTDRRRAGFGMRRSLRSAEQRGSAVRRRSRHPPSRHGRRAPRGMHPSSRSSGRRRARHFDWVRCSARPPLDHVGTGAHIVTERAHRGIGCAGRGGDPFIAKARFGQVAINIVPATSPGPRATPMAVIWQPSAFLLLFPPPLEAVEDEVEPERELESSSQPPRPPSWLAAIAIAAMFG